MKNIKSFLSVVLAASGAWASMGSDPIDVWCGFHVASMGFHGV